MAKHAVFKIELKFEMLTKNITLQVVNFENTMTFFNDEHIGCVYLFPSNSYKCVIKCFDYPGSLDTGPHACRVSVLHRAASPEQQKRYY